MTALAKKSNFAFRKFKQKIQTHFPTLWESQLGFCSSYKKQLEDNLKTKIVALYKEKGTSPRETVNLFFAGKKGSKLERKKVLFLLTESILTGEVEPQPNTLLLNPRAADPERERNEKLVQLCQKASKAKHLVGLSAGKEHAPAKKLALLQKWICDENAHVSP
jgi:hypothetical protein